MSWDNEKAPKYPYASGKLVKHRIVDDEGNVWEYYLDEQNANFPHWLEELIGKAKSRSRHRRDNM